MHPSVKGKVYLFKFEFNGCFCTLQTVFTSVIIVSILILSFKY